MAHSVPEARVIREDLRLAPPQRHVPVALWLRLMTSGWLSQLSWWILGATLGALVLFNDFTSGGGHAGAPAIGASIAFVLLLPLLRLFARERRDELRLLRHGIATRARFIGKNAVHTEEGHFWIYTFEYEPAPGKTAVATIQLDFATTKLGGDETASLVFDPAGKLPATTIDHLPGSPRLTEHGELRVSSSPFALALALAGPAITIGSLVMLWLMYLMP